MAGDLLLYSTNTFLAFKIAEQFYGDLHYVWCSPDFSSANVPSLAYSNPPSSSPRDIYERLHEDVTRGDKHSAKVLANRTGIQNGATQKANLGVITDKQKREIYSIANQASIQFFKPLLFVIPLSSVGHLIQLVPVRKRANPLSREYIVEQLPRACFHVLDYRP
jgi:hypothetical protein